MSIAPSGAGRGVAARLLSLSFLVFCGMMFGGLLVSLIAVALDLDIGAGGDPGGGAGGRMGLRFVLLINQLCTFLIPALVYLRYFSRKEQIPGLMHPGSIRYPVVMGLSLAMLFGGLPAVLYSYELNGLALDWLGLSYDGDSMPPVLREVLAMETPWALLANLLLIALVPAIGEELIFRGILQGELQRWTGSGLWAVVISALFFSAFHLQPEGFLPRFALGAILGYAYLQSGSFYVPVLLHFLNNGMQVLSIYYGAGEFSELHIESAPAVPVWLALLSAIFVILTGKTIRRYVHHRF